MNALIRSVMVAGVLVLLANPAFAQTTTGTTTTTGGNTTGGGGGGGAITPPTAETPVIRNTADGGISRGSVDSSNILGGYYANPLYQGARSNTGGVTNVILPGGFGQSTFATGGSNSTGGTASRATGGNTTTQRATGATTGAMAGRATGGTAGLGGTTGGLGGATGGLGGAGAGGRAAGGFGGATGAAGGLGNQNTTNQQLSTGRNIAYTQTLKFGVPAMAAPQIQADVQSVLNNTSAVASARGVAASANAEGVVTLSGTVADEDEARLIEGMIALTPGVKQIKNDLKFTPSK